MLERWLSAVSAYGYPLLFVTAAAEHAFVVGLAVPGDVIVTAAGVVAARGLLRLDTSLGVVLAGVVVGVNASYLVGRRLGVGVVERWGLRLGVPAADLASLEQHFATEGARTVLLASFVAGLKNVVPALAGASRMPWPRFFGWSAVGFTLRAALELGLGWVLGDNLDAVAHALRELGWFGLALAAGLVALWIARRVRARRRR